MNVAKRTFDAVIVGAGGAGLRAAIAVAQRLKSKGAKSQPAELVLIADEAKRGDYAALSALPEGGRVRVRRMAFLRKG